jgi:Nucleotidyltransferase of unknown function (DUF6036)
MIDVFQTAAQVQAFCDREQWRCCYIGGIAVQRWGEPRVTRDVDLTLLTGFGEEASYVDKLLAEFPARIRDARSFAIQNRVLLLKTPAGTGIDISLAALPFEERVVERASTFDLGSGLQIRTCSAEDLIVLKLFASRPLDIRDAESVAMRNHGHLDWAYIEQQLEPLAEVKADSGMLARLARLRAL